jgi:hypothetical protein
LSSVAQLTDINAGACYAKLGLPVQQFGPGRRGGDRIGLGVQNLATWSHELTHAADARNIGGLKPGQRVDQEVVAELGAAILLTLLGRPVDADLGGCWAYVEAYASKTGKSTVDVCLELLNRTCKAVDLILTTAEEITSHETVEA